jgi:hypothetical protein
MANTQENMSSQLDGATKTFSPSRVYIASSLMVIVNGLFFTPGLDFLANSPQSFTLTSNVEAPAFGETMVVIYELQPTTGSVGGAGGTPGTFRVIGLPGGGTVRIYY